MKSPEEMREYNRNYYKNNSTKMIQAVRKWQDKHPGYINNYLKNSNGKFYNPDKKRKYYLYKTEAARLRAIDL